MSRVATQFKKGQTPWNKGTKGVMKSNSGSFKKGQAARNKVEHIQKVCRCGAVFSVPPSLDRVESCSRSCARKGRATWNKGKHLSPEHREKLRQAKLGFRGPQHWNWRPWTKDSHRERVHFRDTMQKVIFARDNYTCVICAATKEVLHVDHIKGWSEFPELRFEETNCRTVCRACHYLITFNKAMPEDSKWGLTARMSRERG